MYWITIIEYLLPVLAVMLVIAPCYWKRLSIVVGVYGYGLIHGYTFLTCDFILAQFRHETAGFTSRVFRECNNVSGMKVPNVRKRFGIIGNDNGYAVYRSVFASVIDYWYRQRDFDMPKDFTKSDYGKNGALQYFAAWNKNTLYYEDTLSNYMDGIARWMSSNVAKLFGLQSGGSYQGGDKTLFWLWVGSLFVSVFYLYVLIRWTVKKMFKKRTSPSLAKSSAR